MNIRYDKDSDNFTYIKMLYIFFICGRRFVYVVVGLYMGWSYICISGRRDVVKLLIYSSLQAYLYLYLYLGTIINKKWSGTISLFLNCSNISGRIFV